MPEVDDLHTGLDKDGLVQLIGLDLLVRLSQDLGGRRVFIPARPTASSLIATSIGLEAAQKLGRHFAGERLQVPTALGKNAAVRADIAAGMAISEIAAKHKWTRAGVYRMWEREMAAKAKAKQLDLFKD